MRILLTTGIYPPKYGGPAQYTKNLKDKLLLKKHDVSVKTFGIEDYLPTGLRHFWFFLKIIPSVLRADLIVAMDTFSVGFPTVLACKLFGKKSIIRTGGDFLWEGYVERTGDLVLLRNFYNGKVSLSLKERIIFNITKWTLQNVKALVFSTVWQRDIFMKPYGLEQQNIFIIENFYGTKESNFDANIKLFVGTSRKLKWKNLSILERVFPRIKEKHPEVEILLDNMKFDTLMERIKHSYVVLQVSLGDISPNLILDAIRYNRPFICTKEVGIYDRIKDVGIFVDPLNEKEIEEAVVKILDRDEYEKAKEKVRQFYFVHTWENIADEFLKVYETIK